MLKRLTAVLVILTLSAACKPESVNNTTKNKGKSTSAKEDATKKGGAQKVEEKARDIKVVSRFAGIATPVSYKGLPPDGEKIVKREMVVKSETEWKTLLGMIPSKLPRKGSDNTTNSDPILKAKMPDFKTQMVIFTARANSIFAKPAIKKLVAEKGVLTVSVLREKAVPEQHPIDWGSYNAVVVEKFEGQVKFVWTDAK